MGTLRNHLLILAGLLALALPASATAITGQYEVSACNYTLEGTNNSWVWESSDTSEHDHYAEHSNCPDPLGGTGGNVDREGGLSTTDALHLSNGAPTGTNAGWTSTAPTGTTIAGISYERYIGLNYDPNSWSPALRADGTIINNETCEDTPANSYVCFIGGPPGHGGEPSTITGLTAHKLTLGIDCQAEAGEDCITGASEYDVWAAMYGAKVTISDPTPPKLETPTGNLWGPGEHNGYHADTETLTTSAQDIGGGVQTITLAVDGQPTQTYNAPCDFTYPQPCPSATGSQILTLQTTALSDGPHTLTLTAVDAAGNQSTIATKQVTIDNEPPPPPIGLTATPTHPGSTTFNLTWVEPDNQVAPITEATYQVCPATSSGSCAPDTPAPPGGLATIAVPGAGSWNIALWLTNAAGNGTAASAAHTTVNVPAESGSRESPAHSGPDNNNPPQETGPKTSTGLPTPKARLRVSETLRGRELAVHISGPAAGRVRISVTGRLGHRTIALYARTFALKHGHLTAGFRLGPRTAAHATLRVSAQLDHERTVTSTLRRRAAKHL